MTITTKNGKVAEWHSGPMPSIAIQDLETITVFDEELPQLLNVYDGIEAKTYDGVDAYHLYCVLTRRLGEEECTL